MKASPGDQLSFPSTRSALTVKEDVCIGKEDERRTYVLEDVCIGGRKDVCIGSTKKEVKC